MLQTPLDTNRSVTDLAIPGASLRPADRAAPLKLRNTRARYASRWGIEQAFADARQIMGVGVGVGEARNRTRRAVERTVPFGLICFSMVTVWYTLHGHAPDDVTAHRARARWYTTKTEPSYDDMAVKLRRVIIAARFRGPCPEQATPQETRAPGPSLPPAGT